MKIFKYPLRGDAGVQREVSIPFGATVISAGFDASDDICIWAMVEPGRDLVSRKFIIYGTGWEIQDAELLTHISTVNSEGFIWHIFEVK